MSRNEREYRYSYFFSKSIPYVNEDDKTPRELQEEMGHWDGTAEVSDYFFFTDKKTREQFRGTGMTEEEIKKRAEHGIGSATIHHTDGSVENKIVYDRPLDYSKFERKDIPSKNFHNEKWNSNEREQSRKIDKLWDDLTDEERSEIIHDSKIYGDFYPDLQSDQEKSFYEWKQKNIFHSTI